ncbi:MAG: hypothetical protein OJF49_004121 [Ktedonobacterales bacterium]|jgi:hypothetical protein|nr:MAG: hypothetical protein OJF49_004121 [Ktedonobacterales bacterium]
MRLDRIFSEGEAQVALRRLGYDVREAEGRPGFFELSHANLGGQRTMTADQMMYFAEGSALADQLARGLPSREPA